MPATYPMGMPMGYPPMMGTISAPIVQGVAPQFPMMATGYGQVGAVHPDFPQFGPAQPYPTMVTPQDEMLLQQLHRMGHTAGMDGLPGYPYIGAPYIGVYSAANEDGVAAEEPAAYAAADEDEVRGTQV